MPHHHHPGQMPGHGHHHGHPMPAHHHHGHMPHVHVHPIPPVFPVYHTHHRGYGIGTGSFFIGALVLLPILFIALMLKLALTAVSVSAMHMTTFAAVGTASVGAGSSLAFSAATFGIGALLVYGALGLGYLYSSAKECYHGDKNVADMIHSRVMNEDGLSVKGVVKTIGAALWSPFLLIGGLAGMGVKAAANAFGSKSSQKQNEVEVEMASSHSSMKDLQSSKNEKDLDMGTKPVHTSPLFHEPSKSKSAELSPEKTLEVSSQLSC